MHTNKYIPIKSHCQIKSLRGKDAHFTAYSLVHSPRMTKKKALSEPTGLYTVSGGHWGSAGASGREQGFKGLPSLVFLQLVLKVDHHLAVSANSHWHLHSLF
jgi:hypothetical protein